MLTASGPPIVQFGTSRFLQAHVDLFVSEALARQSAIGPIAVVQTTRSAESGARIAAFKRADAYPVRVRGLRHGVEVDATVMADAVRGAWQADADWSNVREAFADDARVIVSNTGDRGYRLDERDGRDLIEFPQRVPRSFPAKLLVLLYERWRRRPDAPLSIFPLEMVARNGDTLRALLVRIASQWALAGDFLDFLAARCRWANSLADRIVSEPLLPIGAVAEPYALWAVERQAGLVMPCVHPAIVLTDDLATFERLKLFLLNLGHTVLAEHWLSSGRTASPTVLQAMHDPGMRDELESVWADEVLPVFDALGQRTRADAYLADVRERLLNPFLAHRLADIAQNHDEKKLRRLAPVVALARELKLGLAQPRLNGALARSA